MKTYLTLHDNSSGQDSLQLFVESDCPKEFMVKLFYFEDHIQIGLSKKEVERSVRAMKRWLETQP